MSTDADPLQSLYASTIDARGLDCPLPLLKAKLALASLAKGDRLELWASDPGSWEDVHAFAELSENELECREEVDGNYRFVLIKG